MLTVSGSPHIHSVDDTRQLMWRVNLALVPLLVVAVAAFGVNALCVSLVSVVSCCLFQWLIERFFLRVPTSLGDGSAVVTGLLLSFNVPATPAMCWIVIIGALVAIGVGKMSFGGLGKNLFNPALVGRVFLLISFPVQMTTWPRNGGIFGLTPDAVAGASSLDAATGATPLGLVHSAVKNGRSVSSLADQMPFSDLLLGNIGGSMGEISVIAILIGAIYLLWRKVITWHIPVAFIGTTFVVSAILWLVNPDAYLDPVRSILCGGLLLGAFFMATDYVTSPMTPWGRLLFGFGCGLITVLIRSNAGSAYPEGVSFAILLMNSITPLIDRWCRPRRF